MQNLKLTHRVTVAILVEMFCHSEYVLGSWPHHFIDNSSQGADGVKLGDVNGDGLQDVVVGWEEGGLARVYLNPGPKRAQHSWPFVTVGLAPHAEDAVFVDLDGDGAIDVVSSLEGDTRRVQIHWAPKSAAEYLNSHAWNTEISPTTDGQASFMFIQPLQVDGKYGTDLVVGTKNTSNMGVGWLEAPADARNVAAYRWHKISEAEWIMSIQCIDMDGDGDKDVLLSDRKNGPLNGVRWLENPNHAQRNHPWRNHWVGGQKDKNLFIDYADLDQDGQCDVIASTRSGYISFFRRMDGSGKNWQHHKINVPSTANEFVKAVKVGDLNGDGQPDIAFTEEWCNEHFGCQWLQYEDSPCDFDWTAHDIGAKLGGKYDRIELLDLDGDGDLDLLTSDEGKTHSVLWFENPYGH